MVNRFWVTRTGVVALAFALLAGAQNHPRGNSGAAKEQQATPHPGPVLLDGWGRPVSFPKEALHRRSQPLPPLFVFTNYGG